MLPGWEPDNIRQLQLEDADISPIMTAKDDGIARPEWSSIAHLSGNTKTLWRHWDRLEIQAGMLYRRWKTDEGSSHLQLIVPKEKKSEILNYYHDIPTAGHLGVEKTLERIKLVFYWPNMKQTVEDYCRTCDRCAARKNKQKKTRVPMRQYISGGPMERIQIDILGPLPVTAKDNKYILVLCDCFTKWTEAFPMPNQESVTVCKTFVNEFICRFGTPLQIHSDQGRNFESRTFQQMCQLLKIDKTRTTSMRPQSNGNVERFNRTLAAMLTMYCKKDQSSWDEHLPQVMMAYRSSVHSSTHKTPNMMTFGREVIMPMQAVICQPEDESDEVDIDDYVHNLQKSLTKAHEIARKGLKQSSDYQKRHYDITAKKQSLHAGQLVWLYDPIQKTGICKKLTCSWKGPCVVLEKMDDTTYLVQRSARKPPTLYHIDRLLPFKGREVPRWVKKKVKEITRLTE